MTVAVTRGALSRPAVAAVMLALLPLSAAHAGAAPAPDTGAAFDLLSASEPARSPGTADLVSEFLTTHQRRPATQGSAPEDTQPPPGPVGFGETLAVHTLNPDFVRGLPGAPPARADSAVTTATGPDGRTATVRTASRQGRWQVVSLAAGDEEERSIRAAGAHRTAFQEPQRNAWYAWNPSTGRVDPLDKTSRELLGAPSLSVAAYQRQVAERYAGQLPGSTYAAEGWGGGYGAVEAGADPPGQDPSRLTAGLALVTGLALVLAASFPSRRTRDGAPRPRTRVGGSRAP